SGCTHFWMYNKYPMRLLSLPWTTSAVIVRET
ncbi:MAG: hypothetical protein ACJA2O_001847, partial [Candidatus Azotimanducaceae bacterium]